MLREHWQGRSGGSVLSGLNLYRNARASFEQFIMHAALLLDFFHQAMTRQMISGLEMVSVNEDVTMDGREAPGVP